MPDTLQTDAAFLQDYLRQRSVSCPSCSYDLRDLVGTKCPECGQHLCLRVALHEPNWSSFVTGVVALSMSLGFSGLLLIFAFTSAGRAPFEVVLALIVGLFVSLSLLAIWLRAGRWLRRQLPSWRWLLALGCVMVPVVNVVLFSLVV